MKQIFIILCHFIDGNEHLVKTSFSSIDFAKDLIKELDKLSSFDDVVYYEVINVFDFNDSVRISKSSVSCEK